MLFIGSARLRTSLLLLPCIVQCSMIRRHHTQPTLTAILIVNLAVQSIQLPARKLNKCNFRACDWIRAIDLYIHIVLHVCNFLYAVAQYFKMLGTIVYCYLRWRFMKH